MSERDQRDNIQTRLLEVKARLDGCLAGHSFLPRDRLSHLSQDVTLLVHSLHSAFTLLEEYPETELAEGLFLDPGRTAKRLHMEANALVAQLDAASSSWSLKLLTPGLAFACAVGTTIGITRPFVGPLFSVLSLFVCE